MEIMVEMSARHVHLTEEAVEILFGKGAKLTEVRELSQPGQFLCEERVELVGPKKTLSRVSVLGPTRPENQVEISLTDARTLGVEAPIRMSGDVKGSGAITVKGPCGEITLEVLSQLSYGGAEYLVGAEYTEEESESTALYFFEVKEEALYPVEDEELLNTLLEIFTILSADDEEE